MIELYERLHWLRKQAGLTLAEVSARTGSAVGFLSDLECGRSLPSLVTLERIAAVYNLSLGECLVNVTVLTPEREEYDRVRRAAPPVYIRLASSAVISDAESGEA